MLNEQKNKRIPKDKIISIFDGNVRVVVGVVVPIKEISNLWHSIYRVHVSTVSPTSKKTITKDDVRSLKQIIIKENFWFN